jgi:hypothetical protein
VGSGDLLRAALARANSAAFSDDPIREVVRQFATMLTPALWAGLGALCVTMALRLGSGRRKPGGDRAGAGGCGGPGRAANDGISGNARYLIMPRRWPACSRGSAG